jgi:hypothetical protein
MIDKMIAAFILGHVENVSPMTLLIQNVTFRIEQLKIVEGKRTRYVIRFEVKQENKPTDVRYIALADALRLSNLINRTFERNVEDADEC